MLGSLARAEPVSEPATGVAFESTRTVDGRPYALLGTGLRKKVVVKVYAMALYVDETDARRSFPALAARAKGSDHARLTSEDHAQQFVLYGSFGKLAVLHFVRDVGKEKIREAFEDGLGEELSDKAPADARQAAQAFVALFDQDIKEGEEVVVRTFPDGRIEIQQGSRKTAGPHSPRLARAIWGVWLGAKPISTDMRKTLIDRIDLLGR